MDGRDKMKSALKKGIDWTFLILEAVADEMEVMAALQGRYRWVAFHQGIAGLREIEWAEASRRARQRVAQLKYRNLLVEKKVAGRLRLQLTEAGKEAYLKKILKSAPCRADGKSTMVVFDVPEHARRERDRLRGFLRSSGFRRLQRSVWTTDKDVSHGLDRLLRAANVAEWVRIFLVEDP